MTPTDRRAPENATEYAPDHSEHERPRSTLFVAALLVLVTILAATTLVFKSDISSAADKPVAAAQTIEKRAGVWIEGPGYDIKYGADYTTCAARCLAAPRCQMIEYYRPEKKCNLYDSVRKTLTGGSSDVGLKR